MKYRKKKSVVEAWRWYGGTFEDGEHFWREVTGAPWGFRFGKIGGDTGIIVWTPDGDQVLKTGEYLLKWPNGNIAPWPAALFESTFELIPEGCANPAAVPEDPVNHPSHYQLTIKGVQVEALDVIRGLALGFNLGNALKYLWRHKSKGGIEDLQKARFYLDAEIKAWEERHNEP